MTTESYERIARYYDLLHTGFTDDLAFLLGAAARSGGRVLELGCGTGRVIFPLTQAGHPVVGLDSSRAMLALARQKAAALAANERDRLQLVQADICAPPLGRRSFDLALAAHNTFMHLTPAEALTSLRAVGGCLTPQGRLILDLANPFDLWQLPTDDAEEPEQVVNDPATGEQVRVSSSSRLVEEAQLLRVTWYFDSWQSGDQLVRRAEVSTDYHFLFPHEMERLIYDAGLVLAELVGDYDQSPFAESSPRMIVIAERRER